MFNPNIKRVLNSKKVTDHHAIIPTMEIAKADLSTLPEPERKILSLVANRLLCATGEKHLYETVKAELSCGGHTFHASGKSVTHNGWKDFEDAFKRAFKTIEEKKAPKKRSCRSLQRDRPLRTCRRRSASITRHRRSITRRIPCCLQWREPEQRTWAIMWNAKGLARLPPEPTLSRSW